MEFEKRFVEFQKKFSETGRLIDNMKDLPRFLERQLPMLMHFEISTALRKVLGETLPSQVTEFEKSKLRELDRFMEMYKTSSPNLKAFTARINVIAKELLKSDRGMVPFALGKDYSPDMSFE